MQHKTSEYEVLPFALLKVHNQAGKMVEDVRVSVQPVNTVVQSALGWMVCYTQMRFI